MPLVHTPAGRNGPLREQRSGARSTAHPRDLPRLRSGFDSRRENGNISWGLLKALQWPLGVGHRLLGLRRTGAFVSALGDGADGVAVAVSRLDLRVVEGRGH